MSENTCGASILCVDDDWSILAIHKSLLEAAGYRVLTAQNTQEALQLFTAEPVDLVITDHYLEGKMTGAALAKQLKLARPEVPVLWMSGSIDPPSSKTQFDGFLYKAARAHVWFKEIERVLHAAQAKASKQKPA